VTRAAASSPTAAGYGSFHGVRTATTPPGLTAYQVHHGGVSGSSTTAAEQAADRGLLQQIGGDFG